MLQRRHERHQRGGEHHQKPVNPAVESGKRKLRDAKEAGYRIEELSERKTLSGIKFLEYTLTKNGHENLTVKVMLEEKKEISSRVREGKTKKDNGDRTMQAKKAAHKKALKQKSHEATNHLAGTSTKSKDGSPKNAGLGKKNK
ncbi:MAG: hypothetical protein M0P76_02540 [Candidatus Pacebacteria bacterium]|jgi:hypothetical protein|nr:hypothetical protein [Candidatus Paceibacterota bacterium]